MEALTITFSSTGGSSRMEKFSEEAITAGSLNWMYPIMGKVYISKEALKELGHPVRIEVVVKPLIYRR